MAENNKSTDSTDSTENTSQDFSRSLYFGRSEEKKTSWWEKLNQPTKLKEANSYVCDYNVYKAFKKHPILKLLKGALENAGCPLDLDRHIVSEDCSFEIQGGYDPEYNQIVLCRNVKNVRKHPETILIHELIHMYDNCVNEINFKNLEHLACTEIRAANIAHCSFLSSCFMGSSSPINIKKTHQDCVKIRAAESLVVARNIDFPTAVKYVKKVFDRCYNDLEPIGRRVRRKSEESFLAEEEAKCFLIS